MKRFEPKCNRIKTVTTSILFSVLVGMAATIVEASRPNIILIMVDDLGYTGLSCYGNEYGIQTPNIDALAQTGVKFTDFHSNGTVCSPSRAALMTGRYQQRTGVVGVVKAKNCRNIGLALDEYTMAEMLRDAGYRTALFGKWHLGYSPMFNPTEQGFDEFIGFVSGNIDYHSHYDQENLHDWWKQTERIEQEGYLPELNGQHAVDFIERNHDRPFFAFVSFGSPHYPFQGPNDPAVRGPNRAHNVKVDVERAYREMIETMDAQVGRIVEKLREKNILDDTLLVFTSDNGPEKEWSKSKEMRGKKGSILEGGHRVPGIISWHGKIQPKVVDETIMHIDLYQTFAAVSGTSLDSELVLDGVDLSGLLLDGKELGKRLLFWKNGRAGAARSGEWKYMTDKRGKKGKLYNLDSDLLEQKDVADQFPEIFITLEQSYASWLHEVDKDPTGPEKDPRASAYSSDY